MIGEDARFYHNDRVVQRYSQASGFQHPGEALLLRAVAPLARSTRVLDIGVGGGRTIPILTMLTDQYVGIDYSDSMVAACLRKYPDVDIRVGDARDLSGFDDHSFDFVYFSYNGIDTIDEEGRGEVFRAVHRVLDDQGLFAFSTLNKQGRTYGETPYQVHRPGQSWDGSLEAAGRLLSRNKRDPLRFYRRFKNWSNTRAQNVDNGGWATSMLASTDFTVRAHFVTLARLREELAGSDFEVVAIYGGDQTQGSLPLDANTSTDDSLYALAKKR